jgi:L-iditol 2-dehydrogenase
MNARSMEALVLHQVGDHRFETVPIPEPEAGEVRIRVAYCGVCGSDIPRVFKKGTYHFPTICGHEFAGVIDTCGANVTTCRPGDPVVVFPLIWCGKCPACEVGQYPSCENYNYLGSRCDGGFAEYVVAPVKNLLPVPPGVSLQEAAMTEPAAVALHALRRGGGVSPGETIAIFGAGPIGIMLAQWARSSGASQIVLFDIDPGKLNLARSAGFTQVFHTQEHPPVKTINRLTSEQGAHLCIEAAGVPLTLAQAIEATRWNGRVVLMGNPSADVVLPAALISQAMRREISLHGTWNSVYSATGNDNDWTTALQAMANGQLTLKPLITHTLPLSRGVQAFAMIRDRTAFSAKVLIGNGLPQSRHMH